VLGKIRNSLSNGKFALDTFFQRASPLPNANNSSSRRTVFQSAESNQIDLFLLPLVIA
jgi:hypothetical protein